MEVIREPEAIQDARKLANCWTGRDRNWLLGMSHFDRQRLERYLGRKRPVLTGELIACAESGEIDDRSVHAAEILCNWGHPAGLQFYLSGLELRENTSRKRLIDSLLHWCCWCENKKRLEICRHPRISSVIVEALDSAEHISRTHAAFMCAHFQLDGAKEKLCSLLSRAENIESEQLWSYVGLIDTQEDLKMLQQIVDRVHVPDRPLLQAFLDIAGRREKADSFEPAPDVWCASSPTSIYERLISTARTCGDFRTLCHAVGELPASMTGWCCLSLSEWALRPDSDFLYEAIDFFRCVLPTLPTSEYPTHYRCLLFNAVAEHCSPDDIPWLQKTMDSIDNCPGERVHALYHLARVDTASRRDFLLQALQQRDLRNAAIRFLGEWYCGSRDEQLIEEIANALDRERSRKEDELEQAYAYLTGESPLSVWGDEPRNALQGDPIVKDSAVAMLRIGGSESTSRALQLVPLLQEKDQIDVYWKAKGWTIQTLRSAILKAGLVDEAAYDEILRVQPKIADSHDLVSFLMAAETCCPTTVMVVNDEFLLDEFVDRLSARSRGRFRPEAIMQGSVCRTSVEGDVEYWEYELQFIHDESLYRTKTGDYYYAGSEIGPDWQPMLALCNRALADAGMPERFVVTHDCGDRETVVVFGKPALVKQLFEQVMDRGLPI